MRIERLARVPDPIAQVELPAKLRSRLPNAAALMMTFSSANPAAPPMLELIEEVASGSQADQLGLVAGDLILSLDGIPRREPARVPSVTRTRSQQEILVDFNARRSDPDD